MVTIRSPSPTLDAHRGRAIAIAEAARRDDWPYRIGNAVAHIP